MEENAKVAAYRRLAYMDAMTGMENRAAFMEQQRKTEGMAGLSYILFDINDLKRINDQYGHREGDRLITSAAACIKDVFGERGKCYRIGGDEFMVIVQDSSVAETAASLERMKARVAEENQKCAIFLRIAAGYAVRQGTESAEQLYQKADANMYEEKQKMKAAEVLI